MKPTELITITIPVWERYDFFEEALHSALAQTVEVPIVVVDNASSHSRFSELVDRLANPLVTYFRNKTNIGMYGNWNRCAELAQTPYFMIFGDDDKLEPTFCQCVYEVLQHHPGVACVYTDLKRFGECYTEHPAASVPFGLVTGTQLLQNAARHGPNLPTNTMVLRQDLFQHFQFSETQPALNQDWLFCYRALAQVKAYGLPAKLLHCRVHHGGNALVVGARAYLSTALIMGEIAEFLETNGSFDHARLARQKECSIPRNAVIQGNRDELVELINKPNNPFGLHLALLVAKDFWLRQALRIDVWGAFAGKVLHFQRFLSRFRQQSVPS